MNNTEPKHIFAEKKILEAIRDYKVDDKLPGERVFAKELNISYMTARRAVENLVSKGILYKIPKKGTFLASHKETKKKTKNIGYYLDSSIKDGLSSPYYSLIFDALEKEASRNGYALIYCSDFNKAESVNKMEKIDGAIISCFPRVDAIVQDVNKLVPVVCIDNRSSNESIPSVTIDNYNSVFNTIVYLSSQGHERIGFITGLDDSDVGRNRLSGYISALKSCGIAEDMDLVYAGDYTFETGITGADYFLSLDRRPTAIMCANDTMAIGAIKDISRRGLSVPDDISVIGFDNINVASQMTPALTTVAAPIMDIAINSVNILNSLINDIDLDDRHIILPGQLVVRDTAATIQKGDTASKRLQNS